MVYRNPVLLLRNLAMIEGVSFIVLLLIAMPLKYVAGWPLAVKVVGMIHGVLFVAFVAAWAWTILIARWRVGRATLVMASALLPFGPFVIDRRMKEYARELSA
jgi:integral membrane protein